MRVLVACEFSGTVRDAFRAKGHDASSCDILPSETPGSHYQQSIFDMNLFGLGWDLLIAQPPYQKHTTRKGKPNATILHGFTAIHELHEL